MSDDTRRDETLERLITRIKNWSHRVGWSSAKPDSKCYDPIDPGGADDLRAHVAAIAAERDACRVALRHCRVLFTGIRMEWTDPRDECREGLEVIDAALAKEEG